MGYAMLCYDTLCHVLCYVMHNTLCYAMEKRIAARRVLCFARRARGVALCASVAMRLLQR